jgi:hypothetical protein
MFFTLALKVTSKRRDVQIMRSPVKCNLDRTLSLQRHFVSNVRKLIVSYCDDLGIPLYGSG